MTPRRLKSALQAAQADLPITAAPVLSDAVRWIPAADRPIHRWFRYREGFSPALFDHLPSTGARLDPFCGCGTTLVESARRRIPAYGIDISPLATFVTRAKTTPISREEAAEFRRLASQSLKAYRRLRPVPAPRFSLLEKIFLPESLDALLRLRAFVDSVADERIKALLHLAWLSILETCSNAFKEGNGLKYRNKRRRPGRYETVPDWYWIPKYFGPSVTRFVEARWTEQTEAIARDLFEHSLPKSVTKVVTGSCLDEQNLRFEEPASLAVFSPPYANRFDYFEAFKMELWMGGFVNSAADLAALRKASMRSHLAASRNADVSNWQWLLPFLDEMDSSASSVRMGIKPALAGYFDDTRILLRGLRSALAPHAMVAVVVGNSAYAKSIVPTDALVARIGQEEGYAVDNVLVARHLHVSSQQRAHLGTLDEYMRESVVVLKSPA